MSDERFCLYVYGRLHGLTRARLETAVAGRGGQLLRNPSSRVTLVALGHSTAALALREAPPIVLPRALTAGVDIVSELTLKRRLGLAAPVCDENRTLTDGDLAHAARLDPDVIRCLVLYDVLEPASDRFAFRDLRAAREVKRLLDLDIGLGEIVSAALTLRHAGRGLSDTRLSEAPWGEIVQDVAGRLGRLDGQYTLALDEAFTNVDEVFAAAEGAELEGDLAEAERQYRIALAMDRTDPVIPFNLGNVLDALGNPENAALAYRQALARDRTFAEARVNLAVMRERAGHLGEAAELYRAALGHRPDHPEALYNLASLYTRQGRLTEAQPLWERYVALRPRPPDSAEALRQLLLCRLGAQAGAGRAGEPPSSFASAQAGLAS